MTRHLRLESGRTWELRVVARLVSEDMVTLARNSRLIVRLESCDEARSTERLAVLRGESLEEFDDDALRELVGDSHPPARRSAR